MKLLRPPEGFRGDVVITVPLLALVWTLQEGPMYRKGTSSSSLPLISSYKRAGLLVIKSNYLEGHQK